MVSIKERKQMTEYVANRLEGSGAYVLNQVAKDCLQLKTDGEHNAFVFLHTSPRDYGQFVHGVNGLNKTVYRGDFVTNIFYKDGKNFFVLLDKDRKGKLKRKSMKNYSYNELCRMVSLREKEREVLRMQGHKRLVYYQPENIDEGGKLSEGLVSFAFSPVQGSYSHRDPEKDKGYDFIMADDGKILETRFISSERINLDGKIEPLFHKKSPHLGIWVKSPMISVNSSQKISACDFDPQEYFLRQTGKTLQDFGGDVSEYINPQ